jgi:ubiquinone/menaquinone biosynthesis C-methylase UbiE
VFDRAAPSYDLAAGSYHDHFGERLVDRAGVGPGEAVLDVACGHGSVLRAAAARIGPDGRLVGVDLSPEMVRLAGTRLGPSTTAELAVMDAEALDFADGSFDVVLCGFGVFFLPDPGLAVAGFRRVLAEGGRVGLTTWGAEDERWAWEDDLLAAVEVERRAVRRPFDQADELERLLGDAGFTDIETTAEVHDVSLSGAEEWWRWKWSYSLRGLLEQLPASAVDDFRQKAGDHLAAMPHVDGRLPLRLEALVAVARR